VDAYTPAPPPVSPYPLSPAQRMELIGWRAFTGGLLAQVARVRRRGIATPVEQRRYGTARTETLEVLHPAARRAERRPVVYVHGGGWICLRKELYTRDLGFLTDAGHPVFNLDYPLAPEHPHPGPLRSLLNALAWIRQGYAEATEVHLMGDSAGGNLAMMLSAMLEDASLRERLIPGTGELVLPRSRSVISLYGVLDRLSWLREGFPSAPLMLHCYGGPGAFAPQVGPESAITPMDLLNGGLLTGDHPPCFLAAAGRDPLAESTRVTHDALQALGGDVRMQMYEGEAHGFFNQWWREPASRLRRDVLSFLDEQDEQDERADA